MFIGDALLGNFDRLNGNWGFLINRKTGEIKISPIYDCGSCLYPQLDDKTMEEYLNDPAEIDKRIYIFPNSALRNDDGKINYHEFINSLIDQDCNAALKEVYPKIDMDVIDKIINETPYITEIRKRFYKTIIRQRFEKILTPAYRKISE